MSDFLIDLATVVAVLWLFSRLEKWRWSSCRCGREKTPWFSRRHMREWLMAVFAAWFAFGAIIDALGGDVLLSLIPGLVFVFQMKVIVEHRKGKRSILGRLLGYVRVNEHGRLVVEQQ
jgi:hypothetical protein